MDQLASPARFHATREAMAAPPTLRPAPRRLPRPLPENPAVADSGRPFEERPDECPLARAVRCLRGQLPPPSSFLRACVIIPAKDEATNLPATLAALAGQVDGAGRPLPPAEVEVIVLANNCQDHTAEVVRAAAAQHPRLALHVAELHLPPAEAHVGRARRLLLDEAARRLEIVEAPGSGLLLSTDADTLVAPTWVWATRQEAAAGAEAVAGRILTAKAALAASAAAAAAPADSRCPVRALQVRDAAYRLLLTQLEHRLDAAPADPWPRHHQHFGASLAVTVRAYRRVGGLPVVPFLEDEALWQLLRQHDLPVRHSPHVRVVTSPRRCGRVEVGLSWQLREWAQLAETGQEPLVPCCHELARVWRARRRLRAWWQQGQRQASPELLRLAQAVEVPLPELLVEARRAGTFGQFWHWVEQRRGAVLPVPLAGAMRALRAYLRDGESCGRL